MKKFQNTSETLQEGLGSFGHIMGYLMQVCPSTVLPYSFSLSELQSRLARQGFQLVERNPQEGVYLEGKRSYLIVTQEEVGELQELTNRMDTARRRLHRAHTSNPASAQSAERKMEVEEIRTARTALIDGLREKFLSRIEGTIRLTDRVREDYYAPPTHTAPTTSAQGAEEAWEIVDLPAETTHSVEPQVEERRCSIQ